MFLKCGFSQNSNRRNQFPLFSNYNSVSTKWQDKLSRPSITNMILRINKPIPGCFWNVWGKIAIREIDKFPLLSKITILRQNIRMNYRYAFEMFEAKIVNREISLLCFVKMGEWIISSIHHFCTSPNKPIPYAFEMIGRILPTPLLRYPRYQTE